MPETVHLTVADGLAEVVLDAPEKLNALDADDLQLLRVRLADAATRAASGEVRALLLRGEGRGFCAGRDVAGTDPDHDDAAGYLDILGALLTELADFPAPTFAAVQGACLGVGLGLAVACDVVYLAEKAKIGSPFANLGATLDSGGHAFFLARLGRHRTLDLIYSSELIRGTEAVAAGLFSRAVADDDLQDTTRAAALAAASGPTQAFLESKRLLDRIENAGLGTREALTLESAAQVRLSHTPDYAEGFRSFQEKRRPVFTGKASS
ncbi:enoyl-CoA hydratase/isomerase family protein [Corynebacterium nuruki]|jgi:2-(1,2-epoxy-1,2-dihydrophenyl)acetyl-CoA isomerase|nr:enoyl-CoA hydratase-related protein [Corynebacterium nuruki]